MLIFRAFAISFREGITTWWTIETHQQETVVLGADFNQKKVDVEKAG